MYYTKDDVLKKITEGYVFVYNQGNIQAIKPDYGKVTITYRDGKAVLVTVEQTEQLQ